MSRALVLLLAAHTGCVSAVDVVYLADGGAGADSAGTADASTPDSTVSADAEEVDAGSDAVGTDAAPKDAGVDTGDGCVPVSGKVECDKVLNAYCVGLGKCNGWSVPMCRTFLSSNNFGIMIPFDCTKPYYTKTVCSSTGESCVAGMPGYTCGTFMAKVPSDLGGDCTAFFAEFP